MASPQAMLEFQLELGPLVGVCQVQANLIEPGRDLRNATIALEIARKRNQATCVLFGRAGSLHRATSDAHVRFAQCLAGSNPAFYQPKIRAADGKVVGLEALIRWSTPERGWIRPDEFIPLAERTDLIQVLTRWVLGRALADLALLHQEGFRITLSVNLSARNLTMRGLEDYLKGLVIQHQLTPSDITLELTETAVMHEPKPAYRF